MPFYSFKVHSPREVILPNHKIAIGEGVDVFNLMVDDIQVFLAELESSGVRVLAHYQLDALEPIKPDPYFLSPGRIQESTLLSEGEYPQDPQEQSGSQS